MESTMRFFLSWLIVLAVGTSYQAQASCPSGWGENRHTGSCVKYYPISKTWYDARAACQSEGADLVKIVDADVNGLVSTFAYNLGAISYWVGLHDIGNDGKHRWLDESETASYFNWGVNQPEPSNKYDNCVDVSAFRKAWWYDSSCLKEYPYVCEKFQRATEPPQDLGTTTTSHPVTKASSKTGTSPPSDAGTRAPSETGTKPPSATETKAPSDAGTKEPSETGTKEPSETGTKEPSETGTKAPSETGIRAGVPRPRQDNKPMKKTQGAKPLEAGAIAAIVISALVVCLVLVAAVVLGTRAWRRREVARSTSTVHFKAMN